MKAFVVRQIAHMLAIKLCTGNMVDCQLPGHKRSFWLSETWLGLQIPLQNSGFTAAKQVSRIPWWAIGQEQAGSAHFPTGKALFLQQDPKLRLRAFPSCTPSHWVNPHILGSRVSKHTVPAQSLALAPVQLAPCSTPWCRQSRHEPTANTNQITSKLLLPLISCLLQ